MTVIADRYVLGDLLGTGGMARVVAAYDRALDRDVAIKLVHDAYAGDPTSRERMLREARAAAGLHHPNIVAVFDVGESGGRPFIVMERVTGGTLTDRLRDGRGLSLDETIAIADATLAGLQAAHARGLAHRDIKPSNMLLPDSGGVKIADFGIAKALAETAAGLTGTGQILGTPRYLAPERALGQPATPATDLYSLGVVLYQCLTGEVPFKADTPLAEALAHQRDPVPSLTRAVPHVPLGLVRVVERALAKNPAERFPDAGSMRRALSDSRVDSTRVLDRADGQSAPPSSWDAPPTTVLAQSAGPPRPEEADARSRRGRRAPSGGRRWLVLASVVGVTAALIVVLLIANQPDGSSEQTATGPELPADDTAHESGDPPGDDDPENAEPDETDGDADTDEADRGQVSDDAGDGPTDLDQLISALALDAAEAGEKGEDLFDELRKLREERSGPKRAEKARKLIEKTGSWMVDGELDNQTGRTAVTVLEFESRPDDPALADISNLHAEVAVDMGRWGDKADNLVSKLDDVLETRNARQRSEEAEDLLDDLAKWIADDEIDAELGQHARAVLRAARSS
ncbi:serine/threonine-protein kinase [Phytoactinopolyspora mesophila]|nr:serine/threonine-protein kinase [Phytoactinopolyspora mesophila]